MGGGGGSGEQHTSEAEAAMGSPFSLCLQVDTGERPGLHTTMRTEGVRCVVGFQGREKCRAELWRPGQA